MSNVTELEVVTEEAPQPSADEPPHRSAPNLRAVSRRAPIWAGVPDAQWTDWRWQLSHRLNTLEELSSIINLTPEEDRGDPQPSLPGGHHPLFRVADRPG